MFAYIPVGGLPCPARVDDDDDDHDHDDHDHDHDHDDDDFDHDDDDDYNEFTSPLPRVARQLKVSSALGYSENHKLKMKIMQPLDILRQKV